MHIQKKAKYCTNDIIREIKSEYIIKCEESIINNIAYTMIHYVFNLANQVEKIFYLIKDIKVNYFPIRKIMNEVIKDVKKLNYIESSLSLRMT